MSLEKEFQKEKQVCNGERQEIDDLKRGRRTVRESRRARHLIGFFWQPRLNQIAQVTRNVKFIDDFLRRFATVSPFCFGYPRPAQPDIAS